MSFVGEQSKWLAVIALCALGCTGTVHDLDLEDFEGQEPGATVGGNGTGAGAGTGTGTNTSTGTGTVSMGLTWTADINPIMQANGCAQQGCHGGATPQNNYSLESYAQALGGGLDATPNVIAGDSTCNMVAHCNISHHINAPDASLVEEWVVAWGAAQ
jgi:hypothetical protein